MLSMILHVAIFYVLYASAAVDGSPSGAPDCVSKCWEYTQYVSLDCLGDQACLCNDSEFQNAVYQCLYSQCTTARFASALHYTLGICHAEYNQAGQPGLVKEAPKVQKRDMPTQSVSGSAVQSANRSAMRSAGASVVRSAAASAVRSAGPSVVRSAGASVVRSAGPSVFRSAGPSVTRSANRSAGPSITRSVVRSARRSAGPSVVRSVNRSAVRSAAPSVTRSVVRSAVRSAQPTRRPMQSVSGSAYMPRGSARASPALTAGMPVYRRNL